MELLLEDQKQIQNRLSRPFSMVGRVRITSAFVLANSSARNRQTYIACLSLLARLKLASHSKERLAAKIVGRVVSLLNHHQSTDRARLRYCGLTISGD